MCTVVAVFMPSNGNSKGLAENPQPKACYGEFGISVSFGARCVPNGFGCVPNECPDGTDDGMH